MQPPCIEILGGLPIPGSPSPQFLGAQELQMALWLSGTTLGTVVPIEEVEVALSGGAPAGRITMPAVFSSSVWQKRELLSLLP